MTAQAREQAEKYVEHSLESQRRLGYSSRVEGKVYELAVHEAARAVDKMLKAQRRTRRAV
jgi:hypothetical protein